MSLELALSKTILLKEANGGKCILWKYERTRTCSKKETHIYHVRVQRNDGTEQITEVAKKPCKKNVKPYK